MTLSLAWVRSVGRSSEFVCATDSRLRSGGHWDCGPKIFPTPRGDSAILFAGDTLFAYPIAYHLNAAIAQQHKLRSRALDLPELKGHLVRVANAALKSIGDLPKGVDPAPQVQFILAGYDWRRKDFRGWLIQYDKSISAFTHRAARRWTGGNSAKTLLMAGDYLADFKSRLVELLKARSKLTSGGFDMEPFEVLRNMLREKSRPLIGGAPQILKIHQHLNSRPVAVLWPDAASNQTTLWGRELLDYESHEYLTLDPDSLEIEDA
jgi:hypothetical protein